MKINLKKKRISSISLISIADVIFLLLIFLLISSNFITHSGVKVNLPDSSTKTNEFNKNLTITIDKTDKIFVGNKAANWENLKEIIKQKLIDNPEQVIVVRADEELILKKIVKLMDIAKQVGSNRFFIATEVKNQEN